MKIVRIETRQIIDWIDRMTYRHGHVVFTKDGRWYDWGQALCVEQYGPDPKGWPDFPTTEDVQRAKDWENGKVPEWVGGYEK